MIEIGERNVYLVTCSAGGTHGAHTMDVHHTPMPPLLNNMP